MIALLEVFFLFSSDPAVWRTSSGRQRSLGSVPMCCLGPINVLLPEYRGRESTSIGENRLCYGRCSCAKFRRPQSSRCQWRAYSMSMQRGK